jgi:hypothetical protein
MSRAPVMRLVIALALAFIGPARADDYDEARQAAAIIAGATVCKTVVSENLKRILYSKMLAGFHTPSQINFDIELEIEALNKLAPGDQVAMCEAIANLVKTL